MYREVSRMDGSRFDHLARQLVTRTDRRRVLQRVGVVAAIFGTALDLKGAEAARRKRRATRRRGSRAKAQQVPSNACSAFCKNVPPGRTRGHCRADCAHGRGLFVQCGEDPNRLCPRPDGTAGCCDPGQPCVDGACVSSPPPPPDGSCVCSGTALGKPCETSEECCAGLCGTDFGGGQTCQYGETNCADLGDFCSNDANGENDCCTGVCEDCVCACLAPGTACQSNAACCGLCTDAGCCLEVDSPCTGNTDCCSGVCTNFTCDRGPAGTACRGDGACQSLACCNDQCCPECPDGGAYCAWDDATNQEACAC